MLAVGYLFILIPPAKFITLLQPVKVKTVPADKVCANWTTATPSSPSPSKSSVTDVTALVLALLTPTPAYVTWLPPAKPKVSVNATDVPLTSVLSVFVSAVGVTSGYSLKNISNPIYQNKSNKCLN